MLDLAPSSLKKRRAHASVKEQMIISHDHYYSRVCTGVVFQIKIILPVNIGGQKLEAKIRTAKDELYEMNKGGAVEGASSKLFHEIMFHELFPD